MQKIATTEYYEITVDQDKNRGYLVLRKFWAKPELYKNYLDDWRKAYKLLKRGFTLCVDSRELLALPKEVQPIHEASQNLAVEMGVSIVAEVIPKDQIMDMQIEMISRKTGMPKNKFATVLEADHWLNEHAAVLH